MIRSVEIQNWRAYENVTIDLDAAVVFFVAPNGVGKSSLVEATRWGLLGQPAPRKAARAVRQGADTATVTVEFEIGDSSVIRVTRTLSRTGRATLSAQRGDDALEEAEYEELLRTEWGADLGLIDNLMFTDPDVAATKSAFPIRHHLAAVLGVTPLSQTAAELTARSKEVSDRVGDLRSEIDDLEDRLAGLDEQTAEAEAGRESVVAERDRLASLIEPEEVRLELAQQWDRYRTALDHYNVESATVLETLANVVDVEPTSNQERLQEATGEATRRLGEAREAQTAQRLDSARAASAAEVLAEASDVCPTCLRPLSDDERIAAVHRHGAVTADVEADRDRLTSEVADANARLEQLTDLARQLAALRPPERPTADDPGPDVADALASLREQHLVAVERAAELQARADSVSSRRDLADHLEATRRDLDSAASQEQLIVTTMDVLNTLADRMLADRIDPLIAELSARWKTLFGTEGLTLEPSGELVVEGSSGRLGIGDLSGGERATALLIARILITASTTTIPAVWFDEPLEHLDPRRRAAVAKTLVRAGQTRTVSQLVVTTYEDRIARQLAAADPEGVRIVHADKPQ